MASWKDAPLVDEEQGASAPRWQSAPVADESSSITTGTDDSFLGKIRSAMQPGQLSDEALAQVRGSAAHEARAAAEGATFGLWDRAEAAAKSAFSDKTYGQELDALRDDQQKWAEDNPGSDFVMQLAGGIAVPGSAVVKGGKYVADATRARALSAGLGQRAAGAVGTTAGSMAAGGTFGAAAGAGNTKDLTDLPQVAADTAGSAGFGAVAGPVLERAAGGIWSLAKLGGRTVRDMAQRVGEYFGADATPGAVRELADIAQRSNKATLPGQSRDAARRSSTEFARDLRNSGSDSMAVADRDIAGRVATLAAKPEMPDAPFNNFVQNNLRGQTERVASDVSTTLNGGRAVSPRALADALDDGATSAFDPRYTKLRGERPMQVRGMRQMFNDNKKSLSQYIDESVEEAVANQHITRAQADAVYKDGELLTNNIPTSVLIPLRSKLSRAAMEDQTASGLKKQIDAALDQTKRGKATLNLSKQHRQAFAEREAGDAGRAIWSKTGTVRDEAMRAYNKMSPAEQTAFREAAAGGVQSKISSDKGRFTRPRDLLDSAENRSTMNELFGPNAADAARRTIEREGNVYDTGVRMIAARQGTEGKAAPDIVDHGIRTSVQWQFTRSVAMMNLWGRIKSQITNQRAAAIADLALSQGRQGASKVYSEMARREAVQARQPEVRRRIGAYSQVLAEQIGAYGGQ